MRYSWPELLTFNWEAFNWGVKLRSLAFENFSLGTLSSGLKLLGNLALGFLAWDISHGIFRLVWDPGNLAGRPGDGWRSRRW